VAGVAGVVAWLASKDALDAVGEPGVAAVEDFAEPASSSTVWAGTPCRTAAAA
jgi:hypothetical protein